MRRPLVVMGIVDGRWRICSCTLVIRVVRDLAYECSPMCDRVVTSRCAWKDATLPKSHDSPDSLALFSVLRDSYSSSSDSLPVPPTACAFPLLLPRSISPSQPSHLSPWSQPTVRRPTHTTGRIRTNVVRRRAETKRNQRRSTIVRAAVRRWRRATWCTHHRRTGRRRGRRSGCRYSRRGGR